MKPNWDYKENLSLKPCECREECGNYILSVKGEMAHVKDAPEGEQINLVTLSVCDLYDLFSTWTKSSKSKVQGTI